MIAPADWLRPDWGVDAVGALMSTRAGGASTGAYRAMNLGSAAGDDPEAVDANRRAFSAALGARPVFLRQVHGTRVVRIGAADAAPGVPPSEADASVTTEPGIACTVLAADCLPVLFAAADGSAVAAAHAGWRGLAAGVLERALAAVCDASGRPPADIAVWLGACIGPRAFEVGADVLEAMGADPADPPPTRFRPGRPDRWLADLPGLAADRLAAAGASRIQRSGACTVESPSRFFSYRRDGVCGRMAAAVWIRSSGGH